MSQIETQTDVEAPVDRKKRLSPFEQELYCEQCIYEFDTRIGSEGPTDADVFIVGDYPNKEDIEKRRPYVGDGGKILTRYLRVTGKNRADVRLCNTVRCRVKDKKDLKKKLIQRCGEYTLWEIRKYKPKIVIAAGTAAIHLFVKGKPSVASVRGRVFYSELVGTHVICTYQPAAVLRDWTYEKLILRDLEIAFNFIKDSDATITVKEPQYKITSGIDEALSVCNYMRNQPIVSFDLETDSLDWMTCEILSIGLSSRVRTGVTIPYTSIYSTPLNKKERMRLIREGIKPLLESSNEKAGHNIGFDEHIIRRRDVFIKNIKWDTLLMHHLVDENFPQDLNTLADFYTDMGPYNDELKSFLPNKGCSYNVVPDDVLWKYGAKDTDACLRIKEYCEPIINREGSIYVYNDIMVPLIRVIQRIERKGVCIDIEGFQQAVINAEKRLMYLWEKMKVVSGFGDEFNPNSIPQMRIILFENLQLNPVKYTKTGPSTDKHVLDELEGLHPFVDTLKEYRTLAKFKSTYLDGNTDDDKDKGLMAKVRDDGRIHTQYLQHGTTTGRLSSRNPNCYDNITEILTNKGWKLFKNLTEGDKVAQYHPNGNISFVKPTAYIAMPYKGKMIHIKASAVDLLVTPDHRMISLGRKNTINVEEAESYLRWYKGQNVCRKFIRGGKTCEIKKLSSQERLLLSRAIAIQADGYVCTDYYKNKIELRLKSSRKKNQLMQLYPKERIKYYRDMIRVYIDVKDIEVVNWLTLPNKDFRPEKILELCIEDLKFFIAEIHKWDGDFTKKSTYLQHSKCKISSDVVQAAAILSDMSTSWYNHKKGYNVINFHRKSIRNFSRTFISKKNYDDMIYCVEVPTGAVIVRRKNLAVISGNCQNIPRSANVRSLFIAPHGYKFIIADFERGELYAAALLSGDIALKRVLREQDVHRQFASRIFNKKVEDVTSEDRVQAKTVVFGILYGRGPKSIAQQLGIPYKEALKLIISFFEQFPQLEAWIQRIHQTCINRGFVRNIFGRVRHLYGIHTAVGYVKGGILRQAQNTPVSGSLADHGHFTEIMIDQEFQKRGLDAGLVLLVHDEVVVEARDDIVEEATSIIKEAFETSRKGLIIPVDIKISQHWGVK